MSQYLWIAIGGAFGSVARFALTNLAGDRFGNAFPWGTLAINISGSFLIALFAALTHADGRFPAGETARQFVMTGIIGGYTTYSAFSLQTLSLVQKDQWLRAGAYATATFVLCFLAVWLGHVCAAWLNSLKAP